MKKKFLVIGAGIGGLSSAGYLKQSNEEFIVVEKSAQIPNNLSNGLHYLHDMQFNLPFKMEFKECVLTENIWDTKTNTFSKSAMIPELFSYSKKVMDNLRHPSSIMDPGKRTCVFVPESNDMNELIEKYTEYIGEENFQLNTTITRIDRENKIAQYQILGDDRIHHIEYDHIITTAPLNIFQNMVGLQMVDDDGRSSLKFKPIYITNYEAKNVVPNWLLVLYMADPKFPPYRITCFNNIISMESLMELTHDDEVIIKYLVGDLFDYDLSSSQKYKWETGRIFGVTKDQRKMMIQKLSEDCIYPIGRFATWDGKLLMNTTIRQSEEIIKSILFKQYAV